MITGQCPECPHRFNCILARYAFIKETKNLYYTRDIDRPECDKLVVSSSCMSFARYRKKQYYKLKLGHENKARKIMKEHGKKLWDWEITK